MLDSMRRHSESFLIYLIFGAIIVVFAINFGPGSGSCRRAGVGANWALLVNGEPVAIPDFARSYSWRVEMQKRRMQMAGMDYSQDMVERMGLRQQVADELIQEKLLAQEARRWGMYVTDSDLRDYIKSRYPVVDEIKSKRDYENWVSRAFETTVQHFEADTRDEILGQRLHKVFMQNISISDDELKADYLREHDRAMLTYVKFDPAETTVAKPTPAQIAKVLSEEREAVEAKYNNEVLRYRTPQTISARHILRTLPADASEADVARARGVLLEVKSQVESGADFAALASEFSQDAATKDKGGDLGVLAHGSPLEQAALKLKQNEITNEPVRTPEGLHLLQVTEIVPPARKKFEEVADEVAASLLEERLADEQAIRNAEQLLARLQAGTPLTSVTLSEEEKKDKPGSVLPVRADTPWVLASQEAIPRIGVSAELHDELFSLTREAAIAKRVHKVNRAYYVVVLKDRETPDLDKFKADKDSVRRYAVSVKQGQVFREWINNLKTKATIEYNHQLFPAPTEAEG